MASPQAARTSNHVAYLKPVLSLQARILDLSKALLNIEKYAAKSEKAFYLEELIKVC